MNRGVDLIGLLAVIRDSPRAHVLTGLPPAASPNWWQGDALGDWVEILGTGLLAGLVAWFAAWLSVSFASKHAKRAEELRESRRSAESITRELAAGWSKIEDSEPTPELIKHITRAMWAEILVNQPILVDQDLAARTSQHINGLARFADLYQAVTALQPKDVLYGSPADSERSREIELWARKELDKRSSQYAVLIDSLRAHRRGEDLPDWTQLADATCPPIWLIEETSEP